MTATALDRLRRLRAALMAGEKPSRDDLAWFDRIEPESVSSPGEAAAARQNMRGLVVEFATRFCLTADQLHALVDAYERRIWPRERDEGECPRRRIGGRDEYCWRILRAYGRGPSITTIRRILESKNFGKSRAGWQPRRASFDSR